MIKFWPKQTLGSKLRLALLTIFLVMSIAFTFELRRFDPGSIYLQAMTKMLGGRLFDLSLHKPETPVSAALTGNAGYGLSILDQMRIASVCEKYYISHNSIPSSSADLERLGLLPQVLLDPWGRPYKIRLLRADILVVQSTGPSGRDRITEKWATSISGQLKDTNMLIDDNLIVLRILR